MLTVSPLAGLLDLPSVKPDAGNGVVAFAPLMAGLLGPEITTDCTSLPPGGENVPVATPSPDAVETPAMLSAAGSPVLPALDAPAQSSAPPPARFAPVIVPAATLATPLPAIDPALAATHTADELRPEDVTRIALPASVATPLPVKPPLPARARAPIAALAEVSVKPVATSRPMAMTAPVPADGEDATSPPAAMVEPSPSLVPTDTPVTPDPAQVLVASVVAPPPARETVATAKPAATARTLPAVAKAATARAAMDPVRPSPVASPTDTRAAAPAIAVTPTIVEPVTGEAPHQPIRELDATVGRRQAEQEPRAATAPVAPGAPSVRADIATTVMSQRPASPMAVDARPVPAPATIMPAAIRPIVQPAQPVVTDSARTGTQPVLIQPADAAIVVKAPAQATGTVGVTLTDVSASPRDRRTADTPAVTPPAIERANASPAAPMTAAAPVILPALQAFGAAIRRAMADERKPASSKDDSGLGLTALAGPAIPVSAQPVAASAATLDTADRRWPHAMAEQIEKLRDAADAQSTRIRLLPDALGPVDVAVRRDGEQVHVHFTAAQAETRQLLADAQPRLADAAEARGVKLGRTDVSGGDSSGSDRQQQRPAAQNPQPSRPAPARTRATAAGTDDSRLA